jgi:hypothetical protein
VYVKRRPDGLGWVPAAIAVGTAVVSKIGADDGKIDVDVYYPAVAAGELVCPGSFDIRTVAAALDRNPDFVDDFDAILRQDPAWVEGKYGVPKIGSMSALQKASAIVNWAHGGRTCAYTGGAAGQSRAAATALLQADAQRHGSYGGAPPLSMPQSSPSATAPTSILPLPLGQPIPTYGGSYGGGGFALSPAEQARLAGAATEDRDRLIRNAVVLGGAGIAAYLLLIR